MFPHVVLGADGLLRAVDAGTGDEHWRRPVAAPSAPPLVTAGGLLVPHEQGLDLFDTDRGERLASHDGGRIDGVCSTSSGTYIVQRDARLLRMR